MKTSLFDFELPQDRIAMEPVSPRDSSRMLVVNSSGLTDSIVKDLPDFLRKGDVMVFNNTRVIPARLNGKRGEVSIEVTLHKLLGDNVWRAFAKPGKRLRIGDNIIFAKDFLANIINKHESGEIDLAFKCSNLSILLHKHGKMPLPPYIRRETQDLDNTYYQTIYAHKNGAVAAPTAGLHFTESLQAALDAKGVERVYVTLHVGAGTFLPVKTENTEDHIIHSEYAEISKDIASTINNCRNNGGRIIAVGTTSLRVLESAADNFGILHPFAKETNIFITPGYRFKAVDILMTNFHLPCSTLFMLVSAFSGIERMKDAYKHAIESKYRFYSYGDASLLCPNPQSS